MEFGPIFRALRRNKIRFVLIAGEVALTLAIVVNCLGLLRDARREMARPSGFDDAHLLFVNSTPFDARFKQLTYTQAGAAGDSVALRALPGVAAVSHTYFLPWQGGGSSGEVTIPPAALKYRTQEYAADPEIWHTLGVRLSAGRNFTAEEYRIGSLPGTPTQTVPVIISQALADLLFPGGQALGKVLREGTVSEQVIGVFGPFYNPYGWPIGDYAIFQAGSSASFNGGAQYLVRARPGSRQSVQALARDVENRLLAADGGRNVSVQTITEVKDLFNTGRHVLIFALDLVMVLLVLVTALGILGLTSFSVAERRRQIGTRRALGGTRGDIVRYFLLENWVVTTCGIALGAGLAYVLNYAVTGLAAGARTDWRQVAAASLAVWLLGLAATLGPALTGSRVPPALATRNV